MREIPVLPDFRGRTVLVTGGTKGIGRAIGLAFGAHGADCILTHKWGSAADEEVAAAFASAGAKAPLVVQADVSSDDDTAALFERLKAAGTVLDVIVSNVSFSFVTGSLEDYRKRSLMKSLEYSAWPLVSYVQQARTHLARPPRYVVGVSSPGPDFFHTGYDFAASAKAVMEVFSRYMGARLRDTGTRFNVVRPGGVFTESLESTFGGSFQAAARAGVEAGVLLGRVMAHEVGHLLLGHGYHSTAGVMRAEWPDALLTHASKQDWRFSRIEASRMQHLFPASF